MKGNITILMETNYASNNFCAYIPNYRLNVVGDTEEEVLAKVKVLAAIEMNKPIKPCSSKVVLLQADHYSLSKNYTVLVEVSDNYYGYVPELRLNIVGDSEEDLLACAREMIVLEENKLNGKHLFSSKVITLNIETPLYVA